MAEYIIQGDTIQYIADRVRQVRNITDDVCIDEVGLHILAALPENEYDVKNLVRTSEQQSNKNIYNIAGFRNGGYASENGEGTDPDFVVTGWIPYTWAGANPIYIRGLSLTNDEHVRFFGYPNTKNTVFGYAYCTGANMSNYFTVKQIDTDYYKLTPLNYQSEVKYVRISLRGTGEYLIITTGQPIGNNDTPTYTNLVPTSIDTSKNIYNGIGYKTGYRLNSSGTETELENAIVSGYIPYNGETIRMWGSTLDSAGYTGNYIAFYDANFNKTLVISGTATGVTFESLNNKYMMSLNVSGMSTANQNTVKAAKYIRCGFGRCQDPTVFTVTLNQAITF